MQPYVNPNYLNYNYQNYVQPYQQNYSQYQQPIVQNPAVNQIIGMTGRVVNSFDDIVANDVPMDGRSAVFPKNDFSEIQVRNWGADGKIQTTTYKPILGQNNSQTDNLSSDSKNVKIDLSDASTEVIMRRFDDITERLVELEQSLSKTNRGGRPKKEADAE